MRKKLIIISVIAALVALAAIVDYLTPKPLDWTPSFNDSDKRPFGKYLVSRAANKMFRDGLVYSDSSFYQLYNGNEPDIKDSSRFNYIVIAASWDEDIVSIKKLLHWVSMGNNVFISSDSFDNKFEDTLGFKISYMYSLETGKVTGKEASKKINFTNSRLRTGSGYNYYKSTVNAYIDSLDSSRTVILGKYSDGKPNFISIPFGKGRFYINTANYMFTNYNLVKGGNYYYAAKALSYLPYDRATIWDRKFALQMEKPSTPLRYILSQIPLRWAYFTLIFSFVLFVFFKAKRVQRIIPVINPLKNATIEFTKTISNLYLHKKDNKGIAEKKARHLLEFIRNKYYIQTNTLDDKFIEKLSAKSGFELAGTRELVNSINRLGSVGEMTDNELIEFNEKIDNFYRMTNHGKYE